MIPRNNMFHQILLSLLIITAPLAVSAQLPSVSPARVGFDPARLDVAHATVKRFIEENRHAGIITLLARNGKIVAVQTYCYRDLENSLPTERDTTCRVY